jgi:acetoin utilization deacetylase AcuC-like enzyme
LSLHQAPHFPGTGAAKETGKGPGLGTTLNVPLPPGTSREDYRDQWKRALADVRGRFQPDFIFISSGFDVLAGDPLGGQNLEPEDLHGFTVDLLAFADEAADGKLIALLEGGYVPERVGSGAVAVIRGLVGLNPPE